MTVMSIPLATDQARVPAIQVQGLEKSYKELRVLRGVDFEVARGSIFALLGSSEAGKTTVLKILCTLLKADIRDGPGQRLRCRGAGRRRA